MDKGQGVMHVQSAGYAESKESLSILRHLGELTVSFFIWHQFAFKKKPAEYAET